MNKRAARRFKTSSGDTTVWVATLISQTITTTQAEINLVADDDWFGGTGQARATIIAMKGWLAIRPAVAGASICLAYIGVIDEDATAGDPTDANSYVDEDIMFTFGRNAMDEAVAGFDAADYVLTDFGKAKRKIRTGQDCRLIIKSTVANSFVANGVIRTLLKVNQ